jgi:hypothetical protein
MLQEHGVRLVIVRHLPKTRVDGAATYVDGNPVVPLTLRYERVDWFGFTLMHEVARIALGEHGPHANQRPAHLRRDRHQRVGLRLINGPSPSRRWSSPE